MNMKPFYENAGIKLYHGDVIERLREMPDESVNCVVTSPPYWGLRDYGVEGQIGLEPTPQEFVAKMTDVFREVRRVLRSDGTCWMNMGDSYAAHPGQRKPTDVAGGKQLSNKGSIGTWSRSHGDLKPKDLIGMPWRLAFALQADGWWLRQDIIWSKPNPMPESVTDRCTKSHEYIFLLTKSAKYFYDADAIKETAIADHPAGNTSHKGSTAYNEGDERHRTKQGLVAYASRNGKNSFHGQGSNRDSENGSANRDGRDMSEIGVGGKRNKRSVWNIATQPFAGAHFATFPMKLVEHCIRAGCPKGGTVLDPFNGSGTTGLVAIAERCNYVGIELNKDYAAMSARRFDAATAQNILAFGE
jgi:DNA modification methylase